MKAPKFWDADIGWGMMIGATIFSNLFKDDGTGYVCAAILGAVLVLRERGKP